MTGIRVRLEVNGREIQYPCQATVDGDPTELLAAMLRVFADHVERRMIDLDPPEACRCGHPERKGYTHRALSPCIKH